MEIVSTSSYWRGLAIVSFEILHCTIIARSGSIQEDERRDARILGKAGYNLTLSPLLNRVPQARKNLSENIILAHLNRRLGRASKCDSAEVQVFWK
jgi:hypothetical protein